MADREFPRSARGPRPQYFDDPAIDQLHAIVLALSAEIAVLYERCDTLERLLVERDLLVPGAIEHYVPDESGAAERTARREALIERLFRAVREDREALSRSADGLAPDDR